MELTTLIMLSILASSWFGREAKREWEAGEKGNAVLSYMLSLANLAMMVIAVWVELKEAGLR